MYSIVYVSSAAERFSQNDLLDILATSRENNARAEVTGMLLYKNGNFVQALEGEEEAVRKLYERIEADERHSGVVALHEGAQTGRNFPDWSMGFQNLEAPEVRNLPGYSEFLNTPFTADEFFENPALAQKLLLSFKKRM